MGGITFTPAPAAPPAAGIAIGDPVTGGTDTNVLFVNPAGILAQNAAFLYDPATGKLTAGILSTSDNKVEFTDGVILSNGAGALTNPFVNNFFATGPFGLGTLLQSSVFTLEGVKTIEQSFYESVSSIARMGSVGLSGGTVNKAAAWITANHRVFLSLVTPTVFYDPSITVVITPGVGFSITSANPADASTYNFVVYNSF